MTDKQPKVLKLAAFLEVSDKAPHLVNVNKSAALELRRLHEVNEELVEALQQIIELPEDSRIHYKVARKALAKATGEQHG